MSCNVPYWAKIFFWSFPVDNFFVAFKIKLVVRTVFDTSVNIDTVCAWSLLVLCLDCLLVSLSLRGFWLCHWKCTHSPAVFRWRLWGTGVFCFKRILIKVGSFNHRAICIREKGQTTEVERKGMEKRFCGHNRKALLRVELLTSPTNFIDHFVPPVPLFLFSCCLSVA